MRSPERVDLEFELNPLTSSDSVNIQLLTRGQSFFVERRATEHEDMALKVARRKVASSVVESRLLLPLGDVVSLDLRLVGHSSDREERIELDGDETVHHARTDHERSLGESSLVSVKGVEILQHLVLGFDSS